MKKAVLFDMDGTLMYTLEDLTISVNYALKICGYPERNIDEIRSFVGDGIKKLIERALPDEGKDRVDDCFEEMIKYYRHHAMDKSRPYEGAQEVIKKLRNMGLKVGIVTNKVQNSAEDISNRFFGDDVEVVVGVKRFRKLKPDKEPVMVALKKLKVSAEETVYVGDSIVDYMTAKNSGVDFVGAAWGYQGEETLEKCGTEVIIRNIYDLFEVL